MKINELRRANLREWVRLNGTPPEEKSYFSQVLSGSSSFGEKAARRVEQQYRMGEGFLDRAPGKAEAELLQVPDSFIDAHQLTKLIELFGKASRNGRLFILDAAEGAETISDGRAKSAARD